MAVRLIDANAMLSELRPVSFEAEHSAVLLSDVSKMMRKWVERQPTLTPSNEWVRVEERLPTKSGEYFAYTTDENINIIEFDEDYGEFGFRKEYYQDGAYLDSEWVKADWITHWMPLPAPPYRRPPVGET